MLHVGWGKRKQRAFLPYENKSEMRITGAPSLAGHVHKAQEGEGLGEPPNRPEEMSRSSQLLLAI